MSALNRRDFLTLTDAGIATAKAGLAPRPENPAASGLSA